MLLFSSVSKNEVSHSCAMHIHTQSYSPGLPSPQLMCHKSKNVAWNKHTMPYIQIKMNLFTPFSRMWCHGVEQNGQLFFFCVCACDCVMVFLLFTARKTGIFENCRREEGMWARRREWKWKKKEGKREWENGTRGDAQSVEKKSEKFRTFYENW